MYINSTISDTTIGQTYINPKSAILLAKRYTYFNFTATNTRIRSRDIITTVSDTTNKKTTDISNVTKATELAI